MVYASCMYAELVALLSSSSSLAVERVLRDLIGGLVGCRASDCFKYWRNSGVRSIMSNASIPSLEAPPSWSLRHPLSYSQISVHVHIQRQSHLPVQRKEKDLKDHKVFPVAAVYESAVDELRAHASGACLCPMPQTKARPLFVYIMIPGIPGSCQSIF